MAPHYSRPLGSFYGLKGSRSRLHGASSFGSSLSRDSYPRRPFSSQNIRTRTYRPFTKGRCSSLRRGVRSQVFCHLLHGPEEGRQVASHPELAPVEQVHCSSEIQDGNVIQYSSPPSEGTLGDVSRSKGRLSSHSGSTRGPVLPLFRLSRPSLPLRSDALWSVNSTKNLHSGHQSFGGLPTQVRSEGLYVPRRLAHSSRVAGTVHRCDSGCASGVSGPGVDSQPRQIFLNSVTGTSVSGGEIRFSPGVGVSDRGEIVGPVSGCQNSSLCPKRSGSLLVGHSGVHVEPGRHCPLLSPQNASTPVAPAGIFSPSIQRLPNPCSNYSGYCPSSSMVDDTGERGTGGDFSISSLRGYSYNRRLVRRLGSVHRRSIGLRPLAPSLDVMAHQPPRTRGGSLCSSAFSPSCQGKEGVDSFRQHNGSGLHQPAGGNSFLPSLASDLVPLHVDFKSGDSTPGGSPSGVIQLKGRRSLSGNSLDPNIGVDVGSGDIQSPLRQLQCLPGSRSVCVSGERTSPSVLLPSSGSRGVEGQRFVLPLGGPHVLCLPTSSTGSPGPSEDRRRGNPVSSSDSPLLAVQTVVRSTVANVGGPPISSPTSSGPTSVPGTESVPARSVFVTPCGVASIRESFRQEGLSDQAASMAARGRRASTLRLYDRRLRVYGEWCTDHQVSPYSSSLGDIADFLLHILTLVSRSTPLGVLELPLPRSITVSLMAVRCPILGPSII